MTYLTEFLSLGQGRISKETKSRVLGGFIEFFKLRVGLQLMFVLSSPDHRHFRA